MKNPFRSSNEINESSEEGAAIRAYFLDAFGKWPIASMPPKKALRLGFVAASGRALENSAEAFRRCIPLEVATGEATIDLGMLARRLPDFDLASLDGAEKVLLPIAHGDNARTALEFVREERSNRPAAQPSGVETDIDSALEAGRPVAASVLGEWSAELADDSGNLQTLTEVQWAVLKVASTPFSKDLEYARDRTTFFITGEAGDPELQNAMNGAANCGIAFRLLEEPLLDTMLPASVGDLLLEASSDLDADLGKSDGFWAAAMGVSVAITRQPPDGIFPPEGLGFETLDWVNRSILEIGETSTRYRPSRSWSSAELRNLQAAAIFGYTLQILSHLAPASEQS